MSIIDKSDDLARACLKLANAPDDECAHILLFMIAPALGEYIKARKAFSQELLDAQTVMRELQRLEDGVPFDARRN